MSIKVFISKYANDGILRVIEAQVEHLPKFGIELAEHPSEADVICNHGTALIQAPGVPSVAVSHGMYWSRQPWGDDFMDVNRMVVETMRHAEAHTAPSDWVNRAMRRGGFWYPETVYHGVDPDKFIPGNVGVPFVLWNKARADFVSDPKDLDHIASLMPNRQFATTIGRATENVKVMGGMKHADMKTLVSQAGVYLATARETFGIGTLEAMAYGIPIAGWDWGGTKEIVEQGITGYLAPPGDYRALAECIEKCFTDRDRLSTNCILDVRNRWTWEPRIQQYADIFKRVHAQYNLRVAPKVSILVTAYKLDEFLPQCLDTVISQTYKDFECIVVDDANLDSTKMIVRDYAAKDSRIRYLGTQTNRGLPGARNFGLSNSFGKYIRHVDADDYLADNAIELEATALDTDRGVDIVYGHLEVVRPDGSRYIEHGEPKRGGWPGDRFEWYQQMAHLNQLPSCVMARREVYERSGGYRERMARNEDAEFWCRVTSLGFRAKKFTQAVTYFHRERADSKGALEWQNEGKEPDWTAWFPWRMGATDYQTAIEVIRKRGNTPPNTHLIPYGAQGTPPRGMRHWYVHDFAYPVVSIVVTVGPGHKKYLIDALDSIQAQTYPDWECVVVNDTGEKWPADIMGAPWAKVVNMEGNLGASAARNEGFKHTSGRFIVWMDCDDYWMPWFLEKMVGYGEINSGVIFSDLILSDDPKTFKIYSYPEFQSELVPNTMQYPGSSILVPRNIAEAMVTKHGGFSLETPGMEDWNYQLAVHDLGFCAYHVPEPLFVYRRYTSTKRDADFGRIEDIRRFMDSKWPAYRTGDKKLMCGCGGSKKPMTPNPSSMLSSSGNFSGQSISEVVEPGNKAQMVVVEYVGPIVEPFRIGSQMSKNISYRFANTDQHRTKNVFLGDAEFLISQTGRDGLPMYKIMSSVGVENADDPALFLGQPITA